MDQTLRSFLPSSDAEPSTGEVLPSRVLYYISLLSGLGNIDDQNRNPNMNNRDHLVGQPTTIFRKCLQCFKNLFTIFLKTLVSVAEERIAKEGKTMLAPVFHIFVELATPKMQTLVYMRYIMKPRQKL